MWFAVRPLPFQPKKDGDAAWPIEDDDIHDQVWAGVCRHWYSFTTKLHQVIHI